MYTRQEKVLKKTELARRIRIDCRRGHLPPGSLLPSVRQLATKHGLSKRVVNEELQKLVSEGLLRSVPRVGMFVQDQQPPGLLDQTVIILSVGKGQPLAGQRHGGWLSHVTVGALKEIEDLGLNAVFLSPERVNSEVLDRLTDEKPLGILVPETSIELSIQVEYGLQMMGKGIPVVFNNSDPDLAAFDRVVSDAEAGGYQLTRWFLTQGLTGIAMVAPPLPGGFWAIERRGGYERAMREFGLVPRPPLELPPFVASPRQEELAPEYIASVARALQPLLQGSGGVNVILAASDGPVAELEAACQQLGRVPGGDVFLAGYDNYWMDLEACCYPKARPVVTMDRLNQDMGAEMVSLLLERAELEPLNAPDGVPLLRRLTPKVVVADWAQAANVPPDAVTGRLPFSPMPNSSPVGVAASV